MWEGTKGLTGGLTCVGNPLGAGGKAWTALEQAADELKGAVVGRQCVRRGPRGLLVDLEWPARAGGWTGGAG